MVAPLLAGSILPPLLAGLSPLENSPRIIIPTLRTLINIADSLSRDQPLIDAGQSSSRTKLADHIYSKDVVSSFVDILSQRLPDASIQTEIMLTARLITQTCASEPHQNVLVNSGVLDLLASRLALDLRNENRSPGGSSANNHPATSILADLLDAIGTIIQGSHYRTARFLYSPPIAGLSSADRPSSSTDRLDSTDGFLYSSSNPTFDYLGLPRLQSFQSKGEHSSRAFPPLGLSFQVDRILGSFHFPTPLPNLLRKSFRERCSKAQFSVGLYMLPEMIKAMEGWLPFGSYRFLNVLRMHSVLTRARRIESEHCRF